MPPQVDLEALTEKLRRLYRAQDRLPKLIDDDSFEAQNLREYYIKLRIVSRDEGSSSGAESVAMRDLFARRGADAGDAGRVLITGGAGLGKSTLLHYMAFRWGLDATTASIDTGADDTTSCALWQDRFDHVLKVPLKILASLTARKPSDSLVELVREGLNAHDVSDANEELYFDDDDVRAMLFGVADRSRVLLLLDGFDEVAQEASKPGSLVRKVLDVIFSQFTNYVVTTRPNAVELLPKSAKIEREVENIGLGADGVMRFLHSFFVRDAARGASLANFLQSNASMMDMCSIPINVALLCVVWTPQMEQQFLRSFRLIDLYEQVVLWLGRRYMRKAGRDVNEDTIEVDVMEAPVMKFLMQLAVDSLARGELRIEKETLQSVKRRGNFAELEMRTVYEFGLLKPEGGSHGRGERVHLFIHLSFQEYLAALALQAKLRDEDPAAPLAAGAVGADLPAWALIERQRSSARWLMTLKFLAGLVGRAVEKERCPPGKEPALTRETSRLMTVFWESVACDQDGVLEIGDSSAVMRLLHLLGQSNWDATLIPNGVQMYTFVDKAVVKNIGQWCSEVISSGYMTPAVASHARKTLTKHFGVNTLHCADIGYRFRRHALFKTLRLDELLKKLLVESRSFVYAFRQLQEVSAAATHDTPTLSSATAASRCTLAEIGDVQTQLRHAIEASEEAALITEVTRMLSNIQSDVEAVPPAVRSQITRPLNSFLFDADVVCIAFKAALSNLWERRCTNIARECVLFALKRRPLLLRVRSLRRILKVDHMPTFLDALMLAPAETQLAVLTKKRSITFRDMSGVDSSDIDLEVITGCTNTIREVLTRAPAFQSPAVQRWLLQRASETMLHIVDGQSVMMGSSFVVGSNRQHTFVTGIVDVLRLAAETSTSCESGKTDAEQLFKTQWNEDSGTESDCSLGSLKSNSPFTTIAAVEFYVPAEVRQAMFPLTHLMHLRSSKQHPQPSFSQITTQLFRAVKVSTGEAVKEIICSMCTDESERTNVVARLGAAVALCTSPPATNPFIGYCRAAAYALFFFLFDESPLVVSAAQSALTRVLLGTPLMVASSDDGEGRFIGVQSLYVSQVALEHRRRVVRWLGEVAGESPAVGIDCLLDLLMLDADDDMSTPSLLLDAILSAVKFVGGVVRHADAEKRLTVAQRAAVLRRLEIVSAYFPDRAQEVDACSAAIAAAAFDDAKDASDARSLALLCVSARAGSDTALQRLRGLLASLAVEDQLALAQDLAASGTLANFMASTTDPLLPWLNTAVLRALLQVASPETVQAICSVVGYSIDAVVKSAAGLRLLLVIDPSAVTCDVVKQWCTTPASISDPTGSLKYLSLGDVCGAIASVPPAVIGTMLAYVHPHYLRTGGIGRLVLREKPCTAEDASDLIAWAAETLLSPTVTELSSLLQQHVDVPKGAAANCWYKAVLIGSLCGVRTTALDALFFGGSMSIDPEMEEGNVSDDATIKDWVDYPATCPYAATSVMQSLIAAVIQTESCASRALERVCAVVAQTRSLVYSAGTTDARYRLRAVLLDLLLSFLDGGTVARVFGSQADEVAALVDRTLHSVMFESGDETKAFDGTKKGCPQVFVALSRLLSRTTNSANILVALGLVEQCAFTASFAPFRNDSDGILRSRRPISKVLHPSLYLLSLVSPLWSYDEAVHSAARELFTSFIKLYYKLHPFTVDGDERPALFPIYRIVKIPNTHTEEQLVALIEEYLPHCAGTLCTQIIATSHFLSPRISGVVIRIMCAHFFPHTLEIFHDAEHDDNMLTIRDDLISLMPSALTPSVQQRLASDMPSCAAAIRILKYVVEFADKASKPLEVVLAEFVERMCVYIETEGGDAWLTEERQQIISENMEAFALKHPAVERLRKVIVARMLADGVVTAAELSIIRHFLRESCVMLRLTRNGSAIVDESEYPLNSEAVTQLLDVYRKMKTRSIAVRFERVVADRRTSAADVAAVPSILSRATCVFEPADQKAVVALLTNEKDGTQAVVVEQRSAFGEQTLQLISGDLLASSAVAFHPLRTDEEEEALRRALFTAPLFGNDRFAVFEQRTFTIVDADVRLHVLTQPSVMKQRMPLPPANEKPRSVELLERVRELVGAAVFDAADVRSVSALDLLQPTDAGVRAEIELHAVSQRLCATERSIGELRDGLSKLSVSVDETNGVMRALQSSLPDLRVLPRLLAREASAMVRESEIAEMDVYGKSLYHELRSQLNGVYVAACSVQSGIVANSSTGAAGKLGGVLEVIGSALPVVGSAVKCVGSLLSAVDAVHQEERLRRYCRVASSPAEMDSIAEHVARKIVAMKIPPARLEEQLGVGDVISAALRDVRHAVASYLDPPSSVPSDAEARGRLDGARLGALICIKLQEGDAIPNGADEVCTLVLGFIRVYFAVAESSGDATSIEPLAPHPPAQFTARKHGGQAPAAVDPPAGGACCALM